MAELIEINIKYCKKIDLKIIEQDKTLPIMYWLQKCIKHQLVQDS